MAKIMLVGLGGTGSRIVVEVEKLVNRLTEETRRDITLATLGIDTHDQYLSAISEPVSSYQMNTDAVSLIKNIEQFPHIQKFWNPAVSPRDTSNGAGGVRILSKISVYRHADMLYERIGMVLDRLAAIKGQGNIYVFVVGSLYGGTGSGAYIDIANIISNKLRENLAPTDFRIIGHFFLPSILPYHTDRNFENTCASLQEYEHILKQGSYRTSYSRSTVDFAVDIPYHNFFLISGFTHDNLTLPHKPDDFYAMVAHKIYYEVLSQTLFKEFMGKLIDVHLLADTYEYAGGVRKPTAFSAFGLSIISYSYENIRRFFAHRIAAGIMSSGFLSSCQREDVEENDVKAFITKYNLDKIDREIRQDKEVTSDAEALRFARTAFEKAGGNLERMADDLAAAYQAMKTTKFERFYKTVQQKTDSIRNNLRGAFVGELSRLIKSYGVKRAETFVELFSDELGRLEKKYQEEFRRFEKISDDEALEMVSKELDDVKVKVHTWWPVFKRKKVMQEVDEFIEEANRFVESNMSEIINEYSSRLVAGMRELIGKYFRPGGKHGPASGFLERVALEAESIRRDFENAHRELVTQIETEHGEPNEYRVVQNLFTQKELERRFDALNLDFREAYTMLTSEYVPDLRLDPAVATKRDENALLKELEEFRADGMAAELSEKVFSFACRFFDRYAGALKPENVIDTLGEEEIIARIEDLIKYCSPFLGYKRDIASVRKIENTMILVRKAAFEKVKSKVKDKYGANYFFMDTDDIDFLMIMRYVHGYDLNSITEIDAIARKYKALRPDEQMKRHVDQNLIGAMEPLLVTDITRVPEDLYFDFACAIVSRLGKDFSIEFGPGRNKANPRFEGRAIIDCTEAGINYKFLDWEGRDKEEKEMARTMLEAFDSFKKNNELKRSVSRYVEKFIEENSIGYKARLEETWKQMDETVQMLKDSTRATREQEIDLHRNMMKIIDRRLTELA